MSDPEVPQKKQYPIFPIKNMTVKQPGEASGCPTGEQDAFMDEIDFDFFDMGDE